MNEAVETLDDDLRASIAASIPNPFIEYVDPPEGREVPARPIITEKPESPKLNRAERRKLQRYIMRKARAQFRKVMLRQGKAAQELRGPRCPQCGLLFIGRTTWRCQCKAVLVYKEEAA